MTTTTLLCTAGRTRRPRRRWSAACAGLLALAVAAGCQTKVRTSDGRPLPPDPRPAPHVPDSAEVNAMALRVGLKPTDSDGNGYPDLIPVEVYLFASPYASSVQRPGTFEFTLHVAGRSVEGDDAPLATWRFEGPAQEAAGFRSPTFGGTGYAFRLSLLERDDELPLMRATLVCRFEPAGGGAAVRSTEAHTIQVGARP
jgi:hypothetical protein